MLGGASKTHCFLADVLAQTLGLEVVVVPLAAAVDEELARAVFFIIKPTREISQAVARVLGKAADICRESPGLRTQECVTQNRTMPFLSPRATVKPLSSHTLGVQHHKYTASACWET